MELERGAEASSATTVETVTTTGTGAPRLLAAPGIERIDPETSTSVLRRCTALATRARVEMLSPSRRAAVDELNVLLAEMRAWTPEALEEPDPTMTVLCAAALQDLAERLDDSAPVLLATRVGMVLDLLREVMGPARIDALA